MDRGLPSSKIWKSSFVKPPIESPFLSRTTTGTKTRFTFTLIACSRGCGSFCGGAADTVGGETTGAETSGADAAVVETVGAASADAVEEVTSRGGTTGA